MQGGSSGSGFGAGADPPNPDWRLQIQEDARRRIVNKIIETLKRHLPVPLPEGCSELEKISARFEEKIYEHATSQHDYLRKISLKMLSMEMKTQPGLQSTPPIQEDKTVEKSRKCKICGDCVHKRRNYN